MTLTQYILLILVAILAVYILYRVISKRGAASAKQGSYSANVSSDKATPQQISQINKARISSGPGIRNMTFDGSMNNSLRNYCVKASYNTASTGSYVSLDMVSYVITRGCRFLDFEVYMRDEIPIVAFSSAIYDPSYTNYTSLNPAISLAGVFNRIMTNAFRGDTCPNPGDPLFVQLRIKSHSPTAFTEIAKLAGQYLGSRLCQTGYGALSQDANLGDLAGNIILLVDKQSSPSIDTIPNDLFPLTNIVVGTSNVRKYRTNELMLQATNPPDPYVYLTRIVLPQYAFFFGIGNSDSLYLMQNYGAQFVCQCFFINDGKLTAYENFFKAAGSAFVPMPDAVNYLSTQSFV